jgi:TonB family protein
MLKVVVIVFAMLLTACTYTRAAQLPAETAEAHFSRGWNAYVSKDYRLAQKELERAIKLRKDYAEAYLTLALVARIEGKHNDALKRVGQALRYRHDYAVAHYVLGRLHYDENDVVRARSEAEESLRLDPSLYAASILMADVEIADGHYESALSHFESARRQAASEFDGIPRVRDRYEAVKMYVEATARHQASGVGYQNPKMLNRPRPEYTSRARDLKVSGDVKLMVHVTEQGSVDRVVVATGLPDGLTESAIRAASQLKAEPARLGGQPIDAWATVVVHFTIR